MKNKLKNQSTCAAAITFIARKTKMTTKNKKKPLIQIAHEGNLFAQFYYDQLIEDLTQKSALLNETMSGQAANTFYCSAMGFILLNTVRRIITVDVEVFIEMLGKILEEESLYGLLQDAILKKEKSHE